MDVNVDAAVERLRDESVQEVVATILGQTFANDVGALLGSRDLLIGAHEMASRRAEAAEAERDDFRSLVREALDQRNAAEAKLARIAELHTEHPEDEVLAVAAYCKGCENDWPCDTVCILTDEDES